MGEVLEEPRSGGWKGRGDPLKGDSLSSLFCLENPKSLGTLWSRENTPQAVSEIFRVCFPWCPLRIPSNTGMHNYLSDADLPFAKRDFFTGVLGSPRIIV